MPSASLSCTLKPTSHLKGKSVSTVQMHEETGGQDMTPCRHQSWAQENQISWDSLASGNLLEPQLGFLSPHAGRSCRQTVVDTMQVGRGFIWLSESEQPARV